MGRLLRLVYVSRASIEIDAESSGLNTEIGDILISARKHNQQLNIGGVLYFANGYFFQCLEGKEAVIKELMESIWLDPRHTELKVSYCKRVRRRYFKQWSMKYIHTTPEVDDFVSNLGHPSFTPTEFSESDVNLVMDLFTRMEDSSLKSQKYREFHRLDISWWKNLIRRFAI